MKSQSNKRNETIWTKQNKKQKYTYKKIYQTKSSYLKKIEQNQNNRTKNKLK